MAPAASFAATCWPDDVDAVRRQDEVGLRVGRQGPVDVLADRASACGPGPGPVPSTLHTLVIDRFQNSVRFDPIAFRHPLAEDDDRFRPPAARSIQSFGFGRFALDACAEVVLADRGVDLGGEVPDEQA